VSYWNTKDFLRFLSNSFFHNRGTNYRLTPKRLGVLLLALVIYLPAELLIWSNLLLDEIFFPAYRQINISQPIFIIGNPRSGTTFLQRLLARDKVNFLSMQTWEIFGAPSILMRKTAQLLIRAARALGIRISRRIRKLERIWKDSDPIHRLKLREPEEDEYLFIHIFSTMKIWSFAAMEDESEPYIYYDDSLPERDRDRIMDFYEKCIQRHYYSHPESGKHYLSKNPNFSPSVETLLDRFPDAKFIYLIRNPLKAVPSHISLKEREWQMLGSPLEKYSCRDFIIRSSEHWYDYPLDRLRELPEDQQIVVRFDDLISDTSRTVQQIYQQFGMTLTPEFLNVLDQETIVARNYKSQHRYAIEEMGISEQELEERFAGVIDKFQVRK
jgi:hypothetical protein